MKPTLLLLLAILPLTAHARSLTVDATNLPPGWQAEVQSDSCDRDGLICMGPAQIAKLPQRTTRFPQQWIVAK